MRFNRLSDWLAWQETLHPSPVDLGLERVSRVARRLGIGRVPFPVLSVAGTNGKGSCVALLESIFSKAGYRVGTYTSPHLLRYNERVRIHGREASDEALVRAFDAVDKARRANTEINAQGDTTLTYFEFGTLAAMVLFRRAQPDVVVLEVGMGGRLDAVNLFDADVALVTAIGLDHQAWLGHDRETIGREKAGIYRPDRPAICADPAPPASVGDHARSIGAHWYCAGRDFRFSPDTDGWRWESRFGDSYRNLSEPALAGAHQRQNAAGVLMAIHSIRDRLPVPEAALRRGLASVTLPGRFQVIEGKDGITRILDVAHNPQAALALARLLWEHPRPGRTDGQTDGRTLAVVAMLEDKDMEAVLRATWAAIDAWYIAGLDGPRGGSAGKIAAALARIDAGVPVHTGATVADAYHAALRGAEPGDRLVVFGSFHTVGMVSRIIAGGALTEKRTKNLGSCWIPG
uniref:Dihydrofolate synthase/folylpolyglutamate synthase n=1 Tax=Candidatus Kentrum sp. FM TaxID=2126340 RepID=A0A450SBE3_9GAMM|nr:MAG: dihydrofolate synthase / folylpolyglutamate synthase [Candidatus Kentron sp. FM]VFJ71918.1 MAG: dihydrofolate synthase / folylpolyglutamate synthase [Candidatus Kentron sp. FM]VFK19101.1 MAG: dihydrofolate synthase / folylpolyglutamate synthase [Candidatus Kentron sp. FM]